MAVKIEMVRLRPDATEPEVRVVAAGIPGETARNRARQLAMHTRDAMFRICDYAGRELESYGPLGPETRKRGRR